MLQNNIINLWLSLIFRLVLRKLCVAGGLALIPCYTIMYLETYIKEINNSFMDYLI